MLTLYFTTRETFKDGEYTYTPLFVYEEKKKAEKAFKKLCKKSPGGVLSGKNIWKTGNEDQWEMVCLRSVKLQTDTLPETVYISRENTMIEGHPVTLDMVHLEEGRGIPKAVIRKKRVTDHLKSAMVVSTAISILTCLVFPVLPKAVSASIYCVWDIMITLGILIILVSGSNRPAAMTGATYRKRTHFFFRKKQVQVR